MKKQMKRTVYEAPITERFQVELEGVFCASIMEEEPQKSQGVSSSAQGYTEYDGNGGGQNDSWSITWE